MLHIKQEEVRRIRLFKGFVELLGRVTKPAPIHGEIELQTNPCHIGNANSLVSRRFNVTGKAQGSQQRIDSGSKQLIQTFLVSPCLGRMDHASVRLIIRIYRLVQLHTFRPHGSNGLGTVFRHLGITRLELEQTRDDVGILLMQLFRKGS